jgi:hypothetical protein
MKNLPGSCLTSPFISREVGMPPSLPGVGPIYARIASICFGSSVTVPNTDRSSSVRVCMGRSTACNGLPYINTQPLEDVASCFDEWRTPFDQAVGALADRRADVPGDGKELPALLERIVSGDERSAVLGSLDDDGPARESMLRALEAGIIQCRKR